MGPIINDHINGTHGCPDCVKVAPWTLERFLTRAQEVHENKFDYSQITAENIKNIYSHVPVRCIIYNHNWHAPIGSHINGGTGCPRCNKSHGEIACQRVLNKLSIQYEPEYILPSLPRKRYDFKFTYQGKTQIIELDGIQHFEVNSLFHEDEEEFKRRQMVDITKSYHAINSGCYLIRIDYTQITYIEHHIITTFSLFDDDVKIYYSNINVYRYIHENLPYVRHSGCLILE